MKYTNQRIATITISINCGPIGNAIIMGENGVIQLPECFWCPTKLVMSNNEQIDFPIENSENINK